MLSSGAVSWVSTWIIRLRWLSLHPSDTQTSLCSAEADSVIIWESSTKKVLFKVGWTTWGGIFRSDQFRINCKNPNLNSFRDFWRVFFYLQAAPPWAYLSRRSIYECVVYSLFFWSDEDLHKHIYYLLINLSSKERQCEVLNSFLLIAPDIINIPLFIVLVHWSIYRFYSIKTFRPLELFHLFSHYDRNTGCIFVGFYVTNQQKKLEKILCERARKKKCGVHLYQTPLIQQNQLSVQLQLQDRTSQNLTIWK